MPNEFLADGSPILGLVSLIPLFWFVDALPSARSSRRWGALWGIGFTLVQYFWLSRFGDFSLWTVTGVAAVYLAYGSVYLLLLHFVLKRAGRNRVWLLAATVVVFEYARSIGYLAFPWNLAAHPFHGIQVFAQASSLLGTFFLSLLVVLFQALLYDSFLGSRIDLRARFGLRRWTAFGAVVLAVLVYGAVVLSNRPAPDSFVDVVLVQQNRDSWRRSSTSEALLHLQDLSLQPADPVNLGGESFSAKPFQPELYVWSETSVPIPSRSLAQNAERFPSALPFAEFLRVLGAPLLTGAPVETLGTDPGYMNGAAVYALNTENEVRITDDYGKNRLIPFAEHVPISDIPFLGRFLEENIGISAQGWQYGPDANPLVLSLRDQTILAGTPICFEDSFFQLTRRMTLAGSQIFINLTNNSWSGTNTAQTQHLASARFRTIETGRMLIRSTNSGVSSVIDPWGQILFRGQPFEADAFALRVPLWLDYQPITLYTRIGDQIPLGLVLFLALYLLWAGTSLGRASSDPLKDS